MSSIRRGPLAADNFTIVSNAIIRDERLTLKARGLGIWLLSHSEGWELSIRSIVEQTGAGAEAIQSGLKELEVAGYLTRHQVTEKGRFGSMIYEISDVSPGRTVNGFSVHGSPASGSAGDRETDTHKKTNSKNTNPKKINPSAGASEDGKEAPKIKPVADPSQPLPSPEGLTLNQRANVLAGRQYERLGKMGNVPAFAKMIRKALERNYADELVDGVLAYIASNNWTLTEERLANQLRGGPQLPRSRPQQITRAKARTTNGMEIQY